MALGNKTNQIQWTDLIVPNGGLNENQSPQLINENQWTACENVEPLVDGVRSRRGSSSSHTGEGYRQYAFVLADTEADYELIADSTEWLAQGFQVGAAYTVDSIGFQLKVDSGSPTGLIEVAIYTDSSGPSAPVVGADFSNFTTLDASTVAATSTYYTFTIETAVSLAASTQYYVVIRHTQAGATGTNTIDAIYDAILSYGDGNLYYSGDGSTWTAGDSNDKLSFGVWGSTTVVGLGQVDVSAEDGTDTDTFDVGNDQYMSQGFQVSSDTWVNKIEVRLKHDGSPTPSGTVFCWICADDAGTPNQPEWFGGASDDTDRNLTWNPARVDRADIGTSFAWHEFFFPAAIFCSASTQYHIVLYDGGAADASLSIECDDTGNPYASGNACYSANGQSWTQETNRDLNFRILSSSKTYQAIADYRLSDASTSYHLVVADGEVFSRVGDVFTSVSGTSLVMTSGANVFPSWAVGADRWFVTDDTEIAKKFYVQSSTEYWSNEGISPPTTDVSPSNVAEVTNPLTPTGTYYVDYIYWNSRTGQPSNGWNDFVDDATNTVVVGASEKIQLTNVPTAVDRTGDEATGVRIYLKETTSAVYRLVHDLTFAEVTAASGTINIDATDLPTTTEAEPDHDVPPLHKIKCVAENRQFIADVVDGSTARPYRVMFSAIFGGTPYYESYPPLNYRDFGRGDGDWVTALAYVPPRTLLVGMKNSIFAIDARNPKISDKVIVSRNIGVAGHNAIIVQGQRAFFLSDSSRNLGAYVWEPGQGAPRLLGGIDDTLKGLNVSRFQYASCAILAPGDNRFQWWILCSSASATQHDRILIYDWNLGSWTIYTKDSRRVGNILGMIQTSGIDQIYLGGYNGAEYLQDQGSDDAGRSFTSTFTMKQMDFGASHVKKRLRWIDFAADATGGEGIGVTIERDYGTRSYLVGTTLTITQADGMVWGTGVWGTGKWTAKTDAKARTSIRGVGEVFKPKFSSDSAFHLKTLQFGVQGTGRK